MLNELFTEALMQALQPIIEKIVDKKVENKLKEISALNPDEPEVDRKEAMAILRVCYKTIHDYTKKGFLTSRRVGKKHLYKKSDILEFTK